MPVAEDNVREELKKVIDPELFVNIVDLGLIYEIKIDETDEGKSNVAINMTMTSPACPAGPQLLGQSKDFVGRRSRCATGDGSALDPRPHDRRRPRPTGNLLIPISHTEPYALASGAFSKRPANRGTRG
jgi:hypothetical protein